MNIGGNYIGSGKCRFTVWAPYSDGLSLHIVSPFDRVIPMSKAAGGYWDVALDDIPPETRYYFRPGNTDRPDPASHFQPDGVNGPSQIIDHGAFPWEDNFWKGSPLSHAIFYELHVGTFTPEGTFEAIIPRLDDLKDLGITVVEIMPVAQFPGSRNWGYDGAYPFAVQNTYGGPAGFKRLVNECHRRSLAVALDVVYNHFGPEGCYVNDFGPYFTDHYHTPWGKAINFDDEYNGPVRNFFIQNALHWFSHFHIDILRLDAVHSIKDMSAVTFLEELAGTVHRMAATERRAIHLVAESDLNDNRIVKPVALGGFGIDAQWSDDLHHSLHTLLTGEKNGYYCDFGSVVDLAKAYRDGFVFSGQFSSFRKKRFGNSPKDLRTDQFVVCCQNHDQIGNRGRGERLASLVSFESLKLAAGAVLLSPFIPLLFMGEEYGEDNPFCYFVSHNDQGLIEAVSRGRKEEFKHFDWAGQIPEPHDPSTFDNSRICWENRERDWHRTLLSFYRRLISLRTLIPLLSSDPASFVEAWTTEREKILFLHKRRDVHETLCIFNFSDNDMISIPSLPCGEWELTVDSAEALWGGPNPPVAGHPQHHLPQLRKRSFHLYLSKRGN